MPQFEAKVHDNGRVTIPNDIRVEKDISKGDHLLIDYNSIEVIR